MEDERDDVIKGEDLQPVSPQGARHWISELQRAEKAAADYKEVCLDILRRYREEKHFKPTVFEADKLKGSKFNVLWSNTEILKSAVYGAPANVAVSRKRKDSDPIARLSSQILERATQASCDQAAYDFHAGVARAILDFLLIGRGQMRVRYDATIEQVLDPMTMQPVEQKTGEKVVADYVHREDYREDPGARTQEEVTWRAFRSYMTRDALVQRFGDVGEDVPLDFKVEKTDDDIAKSEVPEGPAGKASVWEIWDKATKRVIWVTERYPITLDEKDDPLGLETFFPCPEPMVGTITNDDTLPIPDWVFYRDLAAELDRISMRITYLTKAMKVAGVYDANCAELRQLLSESTENVLIPAANWPVLSQHGGIDGAVSWLPIQQMIVVLRELYQSREAVLAKIYEITGISDIVRGYSDPRTSATAEGIKSQYANLRLKDKQQKVQRFVRSLFRLKAEIIAEHFDPQTIVEMSGGMFLPPQEQELLPQALAQLKNDKIRGYTIDVDTDQSAIMDEQQDKGQRVEFLQAASGFLEKAIQIGGVAPELTPLLGKMLMFGVRGFRAGRELEGEIEQAIGAVSQRQSQPQQRPQEQQKPSGPDPRVEMAKMQQAGQVEAQKLALKQQEIAGNLQVKREAIATDAALKQKELETKTALELRKISDSNVLEQSKLAAAMQQKIYEVANRPVKMESSRE